MEFIIISLLVVIIAAVLLCKRNQTAYTTLNDSGPLPASQNTLDQELQTRMKEFIRNFYILYFQILINKNKSEIFFVYLMLINHSIKKVVGLHED